VADDLRDDFDQLLQGSSATGVSSALPSSTSEESCRDCGRAINRRRTALSKSESQRAASAFVATGRCPPCVDIGATECWYRRTAGKRLNGAILSTPHNKSSETCGFLGTLDIVSGRGSRGAFQILFLAALLFRCARRGRRCFCASKPITEGDVRRAKYQEI
jgi:hypothetical protein